MFFFILTFPSSAIVLVYVFFLFKEYKRFLYYLRFGYILIKVLFLKIIKRKRKKTEMKLELLKNFVVIEQI